jgi:hypothetical protein
MVFDLTIGSVPAPVILEPAAVILGNVKKNLDPLPGSDSNQIRPP